MARRIEDSSGNLGTWDTFLAYHGHSAWMELKHCGPNEMPKLRPGQHAFGVALVDHGIMGCYLAGHPDGSYRVFDTRLRGPNWRDCMLWRGDKLDREAVLRIIQHLKLV